MDYLKAFLVGGLLCVIGQILIDRTKLTPARILVAYVVAGVLLGAVGLYDKLVDFAGAGATVPLTGFGNTLARGVKKAVDEDGALGILTGGLTASAAGITEAAAVILMPRQNREINIQEAFPPWKTAIRTRSRIRSKTSRINSRASSRIRTRTAAKQQNAAEPIRVRRQCNSAYSLIVPSAWNTGSFSR